MFDEVKMVIIIAGASHSGKTILAQRTHMVYTERAVIRKA